MEPIRVLPVMPSILTGKMPTLCVPADEFDTYFAISGFMFFMLIITTGAFISLL